MNKRELIPDKTKQRLKEILDPINPEHTQLIIKFVISELKEMFRELSEHRSTTEEFARKKLSQREQRLLVKLHELIPDYQTQIEEAFNVIRDLMEKYFAEQRGRKYL